MTTTAIDVRAAFEGRSNPDPNNDFTILRALGTDAHARFLAVNRENCACLIVPMSSAVPVKNLTHGLVLTASPELRFDVDGTAWTGAGAVLECSRKSDQEAFYGLCAAMHAHLGQRRLPTWKLVSEYFRSWESLFSRQKRLGKARSLGLWGELWCLANTSDLDLAVDGWCGPERASVDFALGGSTFEWKTGTRRDVHQISQLQVEDPAGDLPHWFVSLHVVVDPAAGESLPQLVARICKRAKDVARFEERLAFHGYTRASEPSYREHYLPTGVPKVYPSSAVPRVRHADPGVRNLRYTVTLDPRRSLALPAARAAVKPLGLVIADS